MAKTTREFSKNTIEMIDAVSADVRSYLALELCDVDSKSPFVRRIDGSPMTEKIRNLYGDIVFLRLKNLDEGIEAPPLVTIMVPQFSVAKSSSVDDTTPRETVFGPVTKALGEILDESHAGDSGDSESLKSAKNYSSEGSACVPFWIIKKVDDILNNDFSIPGHCLRNPAIRSIKVTGGYLETPLIAAWVFSGLDPELFITTMDSLSREAASQD